MMDVNGIYHPINIKGPTSGNYLPASTIAFDEKAVKSEWLGGLGHQGSLTETLRIPVLSSRSRIWEFGGVCPFPSFPCPTWLMQL